VNHVLFLAWQYLARHRGKSLLLTVSIMLIAYLPFGLKVLVDRSAAELTARAKTTPLLVGAPGSPLELVLNSLYFESKPPAFTTYAETERIAESDLAAAVPLYVRFSARGSPIVGTSLEYFEIRGLRPARGRLLAVLGECVVGARAAEGLGVDVGDAVISSPESVFDLAGVYPLRMPVVGVLAPTGTPDDLAVFVDLKTAWIIQGLGHGHQDLTDPAARGGVLTRTDSTVTANASVVQYSEITPGNRDSFHFHGDLSGYPLTAVVVFPRDERSGTILRGRYEGQEDTAQIVVPSATMDELLATILTVQQFVIAAVVLVGLSTLATAALVFLLSLRLRSREIRTLLRIGGSRGRIAAILVSEIVSVIVVAAVLAGGLTALTAAFGSEAIRTVLLR